MNNSLPISKDFALNAALFAYLEETKNYLNVNPKEVEACFGPLSRVDSEQQTLAQIARKCDQIAAAKWLENHSRRVSQNSFKRANSTHSSLKRSSSGGGSTLKKRDSYRITLGDSLFKAPEEVQELTRVDSRGNQQSVSLPSAIAKLVESVFRDFYRWKEDIQRSCLDQHGLDIFQIGEQSLLSEMIGRKHWKEAKLLVIYGARIDARVTAAYAKVKEDNLKFQTDVLDCAVSISKLVEHCKKEKKDRAKILKYIKLYQGDFSEKVTIDKVIAPIYLFLLRLKDAEIGKVLAERMHILQQQVEVNQGTPIALETAKLKELYAQSLPFQELKVL